MNNTSVDTANVTIDCLDEDVSYQGLKFFNFSLTLVISIFGLVSNGMVILVNKRIKRLSSTDMYIIFLAITDNLLIVSLSLYAYRYVYRLLFPDIKDWTTSGVVALSGILVEHFSQFWNTYVIVLLNLDRYLQVKWVAKAKKWCNRRRALYHALGAAGLGVIFTLPRFWEYIPLIQDRNNSIDKCNGYFEFSDGIGKDDAYQLAYGFVFYIVVMYFIPLVILSFTNYVLIATIYKRRKWLNKIQAEGSGKDQLRKTETNAILTLVVVTITFMFFQIPDMVLQFLWRLNQSHGPVASIFTFQLMIINSSINVVIYAVSSNVFRKRLMNLFNKCRRSEDNTSSPAGTVLGEQMKASNTSGESNNTRQKTTALTTVDTV